MAEQQKRIINVRVKNDNAEDYSDVYNGVTYTFQSGKVTSIPLAAAVHIFGYKLKDTDANEMFMHVCKRWGWNTYENVKEQYAKVKPIWAKFEFVPVGVRMTEVPVVDTAALAEDRDEAETTEASTKFKLGQPTISAGKSAVA